MGPFYFLSYTHPLATEALKQWRTEGVGQGAHAPRAQALEGAPGQPVGASFKKKIRPRQISNVTPD